MNTMSEMVAAVEAGMGIYKNKIVVSARDGYIRVWNCLCGGIMIDYNRTLDSVAASLGMKATRVRTYGDGRINAADWEDRLVKVEA